VHYQLMDPSGNRVNPTEFWDQQGPIDPNPAQPSYLGDYQHYLGTPGAATGNAPSNAADAGQLYGSGLINPMGAVAAAQAAAEARKNVRVVSGRLNPRNVDLGGYDPNAPVTVPNQMSSPGSSPSFNDRFGDWVSSPSGSAPLDRNQLIAPPPQPGKPTGIISGQPMPDSPLPPWAFGLPDPTRTPGDEAWSLAELGLGRWKK
jgi:hypothetical protein